MKALSVTSQATPADPLRETLVAARSEAADAQQALERQRGAIERTRDAVRAAKKTALAAEENITKAAEDYATALANAAAAETAVPTGGVQAARQAVVDAQDQLDALQAALAQLRADLPGWENAVRQAEIAVESAISAILLPSVYQLLDRASEVRDQLRPLRKALLAFINEPPPNGFDHSSFDRGQKPLGEVRQAVMSFLSTMWKDDERQACDNPWRSIRELLRADPYAMLPDLASRKLNAA